MLPVARDLLPAAAIDPLASQQSGPLGGMAVEPLLAVLQLAGVTAIGVGLARAARARRRSGVPLAPAIVLVLGLLGSVVSAAGIVGALRWLMSAEAGNDGFVVAGALIMAVLPLAWSSVAAAALADHQPTADSLWRSAGAVLVFGSLLLQCLMSPLSWIAIGEGTVWPG